MDLSGNDVEEDVCCVFVVGKHKPERLKVRLCQLCRADINGASRGTQEENSVKHLKDRVPGLVDDGDDGSPDGSEFAEALDDLGRCGRVESTGGLVQKRNDGVAHNLERDVDALPLPARDAALCHVTDKRVGNAGEVHHVQGVLDIVVASGRVDVGRETKCCLEPDVFLHREVWKYNVVLRDKPKRGAHGRQVGLLPVDRHFSRGLSVVCLSTQDVEER